MTTNRKTVGTLLCSVVLFILQFNNQNAAAQIILGSGETSNGVIKAKWVGGASMPRYDQGFVSDSWLDAEKNLITAIRTGLTTYDPVGQAIELVSNEPNGTTVQTLMERKRTAGAITWTGRQFSGLGTFIETINGVSNNPANNVYWQYYVNDVRAITGSSSRTLNVGDKVKWVLDTTSNDGIEIRPNLDNYTGFFGSVQNPSWKAIVQTTASYPLEKGNMWLNCVWVTASSGAYFQPHRITITRTTEIWSEQSQQWLVTSTSTSSPLDQFTFIHLLGVGADGISGTSDDNSLPYSTPIDSQSKSCLFGGRGISFFAGGQNGPEQTRINAAITTMKTDKLRLRDVLEVPFNYANGASGKLTSEKITMKGEIPFTTNAEQQLLKILPGPRVSLLKPSTSVGQFGADLYLIEETSDLKTWTPSRFSSTPGTLEFIPNNIGSQKFFRLRRY